MENSEFLKGYIFSLLFERNKDRDYSELFSKIIANKIIYNVTYPEEIETQYLQWKQIFFSNLMY